MDGSVTIKRSDTPDIEDINAHPMPGGASIRIVSNPSLSEISLALLLTIATSLPEFSSPGSSLPYTIFPFLKDPECILLLSFGTISIALEGHNRAQSLHPSHDISSTIQIPFIEEIASKR